MKSPWARVLERHATKDIDAELEALLKAKLVTPESAKKARVEMLKGDLPAEALSQDDYFLDKVFKK